MPIHNLSNQRRLPRLGKISLGIKIKNEKDIEYPSEVDYFVCPPKVQEVCGEKPKELKIMFPVENEEVFFQQWYKRYGFNILKCKGDGKMAMTWDEEKGGMKEITCPCKELEEKKCKRIGILQFLLPDVPGAGIWQISTGSKNSIIDINSSIEFIRSICGRIRMIPLILKRVETKTQRIENGKPKAGKHYTLQIDLDDVSLRQLQQAAQIAPERALLPLPDESKDELFYPDGGFKPEEPKEVKKEKEEKKEWYDEKPMQESKDGEDQKRMQFAKNLDEIDKARGELNDILLAYLKKGGKVTEAQRKRMKEFKLFSDYSGAIAFYRDKMEELEKEQKKAQGQEPSQDGTPFPDEPGAQKK